MNNKRNQLVHFPYHYETLIINISSVTLQRNIINTVTRITYTNIENEKDGN